MSRMKFQKKFSKSLVSERYKYGGSMYKQPLNTKQSGSSLIEALVSLLVFSVGSLGLAALQTASIVRNDDTRSRSVVIWKAQDLVDRMRSTKTLQNVNGQINAYVAAIGNNANNIGVYNDDADGDGIAENQFQCGAQPTDCDTQTCTAQEMVAFNLWDVFCDANAGLSPNPGGVVPDGSSAVRNLEVALVQNANEYQLYFEWLSRSASNNVDEDGGNDTGLGGGLRTVQTNLCGNLVPVDARLDTYCVRFQ